MIFTYKVKPCKTIGDEIIQFCFWLPLIIGSDILIVAIALKIAWMGVSSYWVSVKPITNLTALEFSVGLWLLCAILPKLFRKD
jgi:hypothetical protein